MIKMILATDDNCAIGFTGSNELPWHILEDLRHFKNLTNGHSLIMGYNTYTSLPGMLPNRTHFVVSRSHFEDLPQETDVFVPCRRIEEAVKKAEKLGKQIFVIGGAEVYNYVLERGMVDEIYLTQVPVILEGTDLAVVDLDRYLKDFTLWSVENVKSVRFLFYEKKV